MVGRYLQCRQAHIRRTRAHPLHPLSAQFHHDHNKQQRPSQQAWLTGKIRTTTTIPSPPIRPRSTRSPTSPSSQAHQRQTAPPVVTPTRAAAVRDPCLALAALVRPEDETRCLISLASLCSVLCALCSVQCSVQCSLCSVHAENNCLYL
jgi:hypothetical protein